MRPLMALLADLMCAVAVVDTQLSGCDQAILWRVQPHLAAPLALRLRARQWIPLTKEDEQASDRPYPTGVLRPG